MDISLRYVSNGVIATVSTPPTEGTLGSSETLLFTSPAIFMEWIELQWRREDQNLLTEDKNPVIMDV